MSSIGSDRALRRLVADLANAAPEDVEAVLEALEAGPRARVRSLIAAYYGEPQAPSPTHPSGAAFNNPKLSPWLRMRLRTEDGQSEGFAMTPEAISALRDVAMRLPQDRLGAGEALLAALSRWRARSSEFASAVIRRGSGS